MDRHYRIVTRAGSVMHIRQVGEAFSLEVEASTDCPEFVGQTFVINEPDPWPPQLMDRLMISGDIPNSTRRLNTSDIVDIEATFPTVVLSVEPEA